MAKGKAVGSDRTRPDPKSPMVFVHVGDLHMTALEEDAPAVLKEREAQLRRDLEGILGQIADAHRHFNLDFVYLPGDLADDGCESQYDEIDKALDRRALPRLRVIAGDHDRQHGAMAAFGAFFRKRVPDHPPRRYAKEVPPGTSPHGAPTVLTDQFYYAETIRCVRCIFLDLVSAGFGQKGVGLDFRLGDPQFKWLRRKIEAARAKHRRVAVFMHSYPADFHERDEGSLVAGLLWNSGVGIVEMGHTHYNELGHDGRTMYAAARSVGQNEDGPAGFAVVAYDGPVASWRFKQVQQTWPFVMITSPADRRLATAPLDVVFGKVRVRAIVLSGDDDPSAYRCRCSVDNGAPVEMAFRPAEAVFQADIAWPRGSRIITVTAVKGDIAGHDSFDFDIVEPTDSFEPKPLPKQPGSDDFAVREWLKKGVRGDQLGPNKGGRKW